MRSGTPCGRVEGREGDEEEEKGREGGRQGLMKQVNREGGVK
jgi:hypothetical protein